MKKYKELCTAMQAYAVMIHKYGLGIVYWEYPSPHIGYCFPYATFSLIRLQQATTSWTCGSGPRHYITSIGLANDIRIAYT